MIEGRGHLEAHQGLPQPPGSPGEGMVQHGDLATQSL